MKSNSKKVIFVILLLLITQFAYTFDCEICKNKIKASTSYFRFKQKIYCSKKCLKKTQPKCSLCQKHTNKIYKKKDGKTYCPTCIVAVAPKCIVCKVSTFGKSFLKKDGKIYCTEKCFLTTVTACFICKKKETGMSKIDSIYYCSVCIKLPQCYSCSQISTENMQLDGRDMCTKCLTDGINDQAIANKIYLEVKDLMNSKFSMQTTEGLPMKLVDMDEMKKIKEDESSKERGLYHVSRIVKHKIFKQGDVVIKREKIEVKSDRNIYILTYLQRKDFIKVVAHELMHDWVAVNYPKLKDEKICEGLSEYMSSLINIHYGNLDLNIRMLKNKDPIYGAGFRMIKSKDCGAGISDIKKWLKNTYGN